MERAIFEEIVIVGAGIAGLTTSLGLHRLGVPSLVLEASDSLRVNGFALTIWENGWKALDAVGVGDILRHQHMRLNRNVTTSSIMGQQTSSISFFNATGKHGASEVRCVRRKLLLEALANELPRGTIRYSSKVTAIEEESGGFSKIVHLVDGTIIKTKVLIGCDGINSMVAKWLGFKEKTSFTGRYAIRGCAKMKSNHGHGLEPAFMHFFGKGFRAGVLPCDHKTVYWFLTCTPTNCKDKEELVKDPAKMKQFVLRKLENTPIDIKSVIENTELDYILSSPLRFRPLWELVFGNIRKGNVCVAGDAFHPMAPDLGQGGCCALEDGVTLARCLAEAFSNKISISSSHIIEKKDIEKEEVQYKRIEAALRKYANERRWRCFGISATSLILGFIMQGDLGWLSYLRDKVLATFLAELLLKKSYFDCGKLHGS